MQKIYGHLPHTPQCTPPTLEVAESNANSNDTHNIIPGAGDHFVGIDADLHNVVEQRKQRRQREGRHEQRDEPKLHRARGDVVRLRGWVCVCVCVCVCRRAR